MKLVSISFRKVKYGDNDEPRIADMLRYDFAFINPAYPGIVAFPKFHTVDRGDFGGNINMARWKSFGVYIMEEISADNIAAIVANLSPDNWYTYRHPRRIANPQGPLDYFRLEKIPLSEYIKLDDLYL